MLKEQLKARALGVTDSIVGGAIFLAILSGISTAGAWYSAHTFQLAGYARPWVVLIGVVVFLAIAVGLNLISLVIVRHRRPETETRGETPQHLATVGPPRPENSPPEPGVAGCQDRWLHDIAEAQAADISSYVKIERVTMIMPPSAHPVINFYLYIRNSSNYPVTLDDPEGRSIAFGGKPLSYPITVLSNELKGCQPLEVRMLSIEQPLRREEAEHISECGDNARIYFSLDGLKITIRGGDGFTQVKPQRLVTKDKLPEFPAPDVKELKEQIGRLERANAAIAKEKQETDKRLGSELAALKTNYKWLYGIAEEDKKDISKAVFVTVKDVTNHLTDSIPRIYFTFSAFNGSVYRVSINPSAEGEIRCGKRSLMGAMKVEGFTNLEHGRLGDFTLTFEPTPAGVNFILEAQKRGEDWFWFDQLAIKVGAGDDKEVESKRLKLPEDVYSTNTADRVKALKARHESEKNEWRKRAEIITTLSEVLGMGEELMITYKLPDRVPPEHIEEWRRHVQAALHRCYGERGLVKFYPFPYEGNVLAGPTPVYPQGQWFDEHRNRLRELIAAEYNVQETD
jgi:hypothetical protein